MYLFLTLIVSQSFAFQIKKEQLKLRIDSLNILGWEVKQNDILDAFELSQEARRLSDNISYQKGLQFSNKNLSVLYIFKSEYDSALEGAKLFLSLSIELDDSTEIANAYNILGSINYHKGELEEGINYYLKSLKVKEKLGDLQGTAKLYNNISNIYFSQNNLEKNLEYNFKSLRIKEELIDSIGLANSYNNLGYTYQKLKQFDSALYYCKKGLKIISLKEDKILESSLYSNTGAIYLEIEKLDSALLTYQKSLEISKEVKEKRTIIYSYIGIGKVYMKKGLYNTALPYLEEGERRAVGVNVVQEIANSYQALSQVHASLENYSQAYDYQLKYRAYNDSLTNEKNKKAVEELERKYNYENQQRQILYLEKENQFREELFIKQRRIGAGLILVLIIMGGLAYILKRNNKAKLLAIEQLEQKNSEVVLKNQEIQNQQQSIEDQNLILDEKNRSLVKLDEDKNHLMSVVAHDLRGPLGNIMGLVNIINFDDGNLTSKQSELISKINQSAESLNEMISKVLSKDNIGSAELDVKIEASSINDVILKSVNEMSQKADLKNIEIYFEPNAQISNAKLDANFAFQVLTNLISNALKFSPPSSSIYIETVQKDKFLEVHVQDEGPGISKEDQEKLFGRYQRLSAKPTAGETSTGLGLSIVKQYMDMMGGGVVYKSVVGKGAKFVVCFGIA